MQIEFVTKEESNQRRDQEALSRTGSERFEFFLVLCEELQIFSKRRNSRENHFILNK